MHFVYRYIYNDKGGAKVRTNKERNEQTKLKSDKQKTYWKSDNKFTYRNTLTNREKKNKLKKF